MNQKLSMKEFADQLKEEPKTEKGKAYQRLTAVTVEDVAVVSASAGGGWAWT